MFGVQSITENKIYRQKGPRLDVWRSWPTGKVLVLFGAPQSFSSAFIAFATFSVEDFVVLLLSLCCMYRSEFFIGRFHCHGNTA